MKEVYVLRYKIEYILISDWYHYHLVDMKWTLMQQFKTYCRCWTCVFGRTQLLKIFWDFEFNATLIVCYSKILHFLSDTLSWKTFENGSHKTYWKMETRHKNNEKLCFSWTIILLPSWIKYLLKMKNIYHML